MIGRDDILLVGRSKELRDGEGGGGDDHGGKSCLVYQITSLLVREGGNRKDDFGSENGFGYIEKRLELSRTSQIFKPTESALFDNVRFSRLYLSKTSYQIF